MEPGAMLLFAHCAGLQTVAFVTLVWNSENLTRVGISSLLLGSKSMHLVLDLDSFSNNNIIFFH
jgi:hypothetical protein